MVFHFLPALPEMTAIGAFLAIWVIMTAVRADRASKANFKEGLRPAQRMVFGLLWLPAAVMLVACAVLVVIETTDLVDALAAMVYVLLALGAAIVSFAMLSIAWPFPHCD